MRRLLGSFTIQTMICTRVLLHPHSSAARSNQPTTRYFAVSHRRLTRRVIWIQTWPDIRRATAGLQTVTAGGRTHVTATIHPPCQTELSPPFAVHQLTTPRSCRPPVFNRMVLTLSLSKRSLLAPPRLQKWNRRRGFTLAVAPTPSLEVYHGESLLPPSADPLQ